MNATLTKMKLTFEDLREDSCHFFTLLSIILGGLSRIVRIGPQTIGPQDISGIQMRLYTVVMVTNRIHVKRFNVISSTI